LLAAAAVVVGVGDVGVGGDFHPWRRRWGRSRGEIIDAVRRATKALLFESRLNGHASAASAEEEGRAQSEAGGRRDS